MDWFRKLKEKRILILVVLSLILIGLAGWWILSIRQADNPESKYEKFFVKEVMANVEEEVMPLDAFLKRLGNHEVEKVYRQFREEEPGILIKYFVKFKAEDGYNLVYVPASYAIVITEGLVPMQISLDTYLTQLERIPFFVMTSDPKAAMSKENIIVSGLFIAVFLVALIFLLRWQFRGGGFSKTKTQKMEHLATFDDVGGIDEAKEETAEIVTVLKNPEPYLLLNARVPHGILLHGPPGTGKTLLARAVAGEAGVPHFSISGSEFVEMFVGVGASRARNLFKEAEKVAPSVLIIDELDSAAPKRGASSLGEHQEYTGLVNQLLSLLDRIEKENIPVFVMGITNRPDMLDSALLRPGRLDRHIEVPLPSFDGRKTILKIHLTRPKIRPIDFNINGKEVDEIARETEGFSGAHLAMLANEAAIRAVREKRKVITLEDFRQSIERVLMGPTKKLRQDKGEIELVAWHEAGHALTALLLPEADPVHFVTILPHGRSLGYTRLLPETEYHVVSEDKIFNQIKYGLGGRVAEQIRFGKRSTGAAGDLKIITSIARNAVCAFGMSKLGPISVDDPINDYYIPQLWSPKMREEVDKEVLALVERCEKETLQILEGNKPLLEKLVQALLKEKRLIRAEIEGITGIKKQAVDI